MTLAELWEKAAEASKAVIAANKVLENANDLQLKMMEKVEKDNQRREKGKQVTNPVTEKQILFAEQAIGQAYRMVERVTMRFDSITNEIASKDPDADFDAMIEETFGHKKDIKNLGKRIGKGVIDDAKDKSQCMEMLDITQDELDSLRRLNPKTRSKPKSPPKPVNILLARKVAKPTFTSSN